MASLPHALDLSRCSLNKTTRRYSDKKKSKQEKTICAAFWTTEDDGMT